jgi:hypothetical protein
MSFSPERAAKLIGKKRSEYVCNQVVNEVLNGDKNFGGRAATYLKWGTRIYMPVAGAIIVNAVGSHIGIFISPTEFIHSSLSRHEVIKVNLNQLRPVFGQDYQIRYKP